MINLPEKVKLIINTLKKSGFDAFAVGGCVRDCLLGKSPNDWDITTNALPCDIKKIFEKTVPTGESHGTVTVIIDSEPFEVTTYRLDGEYKDNRHPLNVSFVKNLEDDLARRDFTINALAFNEDSGLCDLFCGQADLKNKIIRCIGSPSNRFTEDALRMMRAVRFSAQLGFKIEEKTFLAIKENAHLIKNVSRERIKTELDKILLSQNPHYVGILNDCGILEHIIPELYKCFFCKQNIKYHIYDVANHSLMVVKNLPCSLALRYAGLFHDLGKPLKKETDENGIDSFKGHAQVSEKLSEEIMTRLRFDNETKDKVKRLILHHDREILPESKYVKRAIFRVGDDIFRDLIFLKWADARAQNQELVSYRYEIYDEILRIYDEIKEKKEPFSVKNLAIDGHDLINLGYRGKEIGEKLKCALFFVIDNPEFNTKEKILNYIQKL